MKVKILISMLLLGMSIKAMEIGSEAEFQQVQQAFVSGQIEQIQQVMDVLNMQKQILYLSLPVLQSYIEQINIDELNLKQGVLEAVFHEDLDLESISSLGSAYDGDSEVSSNYGTPSDISDLSEDRVEVIIENSREAKVNKPAENNFITTLNNYPIEVLGGMSALSAGMALVFNKMIAIRSREKEKQKQNKPNKKLKKTYKRKKAKCSNNNA